MRLLFSFTLILSLCGLLVECASLGFLNEDTDSYRYEDSVLSRHKRQSPKDRSNWKENAKVTSSIKAKENTKAASSNKVEEKATQQTNQQEPLQIEPLLPTPRRQSSAAGQQRPRGGQFRPVIIQDGNGNGRLALAYFPSRFPSGDIGSSELGGQSQRRQPVIIMNVNSGSPRPPRRRPVQPFNPFGFMPWAFAFAAARN